MKGRMTNMELLQHIATFSKFGALAEMFIIDALLKHSERVAKADPAAVDSALVSGEAWVGVAKEINETLTLHYGRN